MFKIDDQVSVWPATLTEKNRVREHGVVWQVIRTSGALNPEEALLKANETGHVRWWHKSQLTKVMS